MSMKNEYANLLRSGIPLTELPLNVLVCLLDDEFKGLHESLGKL
jgi:hypothetical protein